MHIWLRMCAIVQCTTLIWLHLPLHSFFLCFTYRFTLGFPWAIGVVTGKGNGARLPNTMNVPK